MPLTYSTRSGRRSWFPFEGHLLGNGEIVVFRGAPVDEVDGFRDLAGLGFHWHAIAQQIINSLVVPVEAPAVVGRLGAQFVGSDIDLCFGIPAPGQKGRDNVLFDVAIVVAVGLLCDNYLDRLTTINLAVDCGRNPTP